MAQKGSKKGSSAEEAMRIAFLSKNYFVVRDVPFSYGQFDVTDIDLWLYGTAGVFRERISVDIKNKKTPQAIERIMWALGVRQALGLSKCIVVTTEKRSEIVDFGRKQGVLVIDGEYLKFAVQSGQPSDRISEEQFLNAIKPPNAGELSKHLCERYITAKERLLTGMHYDGANSHLLAVTDCFQDLSAYPGARASVRRVLYAIASYLLVTLDWMISRNEFQTEDAREKQLEDGLKYGTAGRSRISGFVRLLEQCKSGSDQDVFTVIDSIAAKVERGAESVRADVIAEYITRTLGNDTLVPLAKQFEAEAFKPTVCSFANLNADMKATLLMLVDFCDMERKDALAW